MPRALLLSVLAWLAIESTLPRTPGDGPETDVRPNVLFCIADDWGWPHAGAYGDPVVATPSFDRIAAEGVLFERAFVASPSCTPSRNAILTGQHPWRLADGACLHSTLDRAHPVFPLLFEDAGYHVGRWRKSWGPGRLGPGGWAEQHPAGREYRGGLAAFLDARPDGAPFCFWLGASDPHRGYRAGSGAESGMDLGAVHVPPFFPDEERVRSDIADYYFEVQRFDRDVGAALALLEERGELEDTIVVVTGDHGMPFPRCKSNLYDWGTRVPLAIRWGAGVRGGVRDAGLASLVDVAPTLLELAGLEVPEVMTGRSLAGRLLPDHDEGPSNAREHVILGKERHVPSQPLPAMVGYPCRAIRTDRWLLVRNFAPERWPNGIADAELAPMGWAYSDCDDGPTKAAILDLADEEEGARFFAWSFGKRPAVELYDVRSDPYQLVDRAGDAELREVRADLEARLEQALVAIGDPRVVGGAEVFDAAPYYGSSRRAAER